MVQEVVRKPTQEDVQYLIDNIREEDVIECRALNGGTIEDSLLNTKNLLDNSMVWAVNGNVVCMFGVNPCGDGVGVVWLLGTDEFDNYSKMFVLRCKRVFKQVIKGYDYLFNYVYEKNIKSVNWIEWLGFTVHRAEPVGIKGANFHKFDMRNV